MCRRSNLLKNPVRFRTEISVGFCCRTAKFSLWGTLNRRALLRPALGLEGVAGHVQ